jgi:hypothetical protein
MVAGVMKRLVIANSRSWETIPSFLLPALIPWKFLILSLVFRHSRNCSGAGRKVIPWV